MSEYRHEDAYGLAAVDHDVRIDFDRLRKDRMQRAKEHVKKHGLGAVLCFDMNNIRYATSTTLGEWTRDKMVRYCLVPKDDDPILFEFGSAIEVKKVSAPWLKGSIRPAIRGFRGSPDSDAIAKRCAEDLVKVLKDHGLADEPLGVDIIDIPTMKALTVANIEVADGMRAMLEARSIKTKEEVACIRIACAMTEAAFDKVREAVRPGVKENELVGIVAKTLFSLGADDVEGANCESGPRSNPHHHDFADRIIRPRDVVFLDIWGAYNGYRTCYYRTFVCGKPTQHQKDLYQQALDWELAAINAVKPGNTTADIANKWPGPEAWGLKTEEEVFGNCIGHGVGLSLHEMPVVSRMISLNNPMTIKPGMVFALETFVGIHGEGNNGMRIEEMLHVTEAGCEVLTKYPVDELIVGGGAHSIY